MGAPVTLRVFEHQRVVVGEAVPTARDETHTLTSSEHENLARFADATSNRYLSAGRRDVRFSKYVGVLQLGRLTIEILPKADHATLTSQTERAHWHRVLIQMLRTVGDLGLEDRDEANLATTPSLLFELFIRRFLADCDQLLREGLTKSYRTEEGNRTSFRGRLLVGQHVRHNASNAARFYVASPIYDHTNLPNLALHEALLRLATLPLSGFVRAHAHAVAGCFPELPRWVPDRPALQRHVPNRQTARYERALRFAKLILFELTPDVRAGGEPALALLFNMHQLFERYVATLGRRLLLPGLTVRAQDSVNFWRAESVRSLHPDLTLRDSEGNVQLIVDTKWKVPKKRTATGSPSPSSADLKQMFCYHELFDCSRSLLLYPSATAESRRHPPGRFLGRDHRCSLAFLAVGGDVAGELRLLLQAPHPEAQ